MKVLVAPSCFKEGLSAPQVADAIARGVRRAQPDAEVTVFPLSDGGEGFSKLLAAAVAGDLKTVTVPGPRGESVEATFALFGAERERVAALDIASVAGLRLIPTSERDPSLVSSRGVGHLLRAAVAAGARRFIVGCGDSGTSDGGAGMAHALGVKFLDGDGEEFDPLPCHLPRLEHIDISNLDPALRDVPVEVACSLHVPLTGPNGTARVYSPQKGADPQTADLLEAALLRLATVIRRDLGVEVRDLPGGGAAGGLGAGLVAFLGARLVNRYDLIFRYLPFEDALGKADLVITGEGSLDRRTLLGKVPAEIVRRARTAQVPVIAIVGQVGDGVEEVLAAGLDAYLPILRSPITLDEAMRRADELIANAGEAVMRLVSVGRDLREHEPTR